MSSGFPPPVPMTATSVVTARDANADAVLATTSWATRKTGLRCSGRRAILAIAVLVVSLPVTAQPGPSPATELDFDRPEAWAMKYFAAVSLPTGLVPTGAVPDRSFELGLELGWIPSLDREQRRVGFNGTKVEDLNKNSLFARPRARLGLGRAWFAELGWVPPVQVNGVRTNLIFLAFDGPLAEWGRWGLGLRAYAQRGSSEGDFTCSAEQARLEPGAPDNEYGCESPSNDEVFLNLAGTSLALRYELGRASAVFEGALHAVYNDLEFRVDAVTFGQVDRRRLRTDGWTAAVSLGAGWAVGERTFFGAEVLYCPLERSTEQGGRDNDAMLNVRMVLRHVL